MNLIFGTYNSSKLENMKKMLEGLQIKIIGLNKLDVNLGEAEETGKTPLENAEQKAEFYYKYLKKPVFSCDSGLFFENVAEEDQPGVFVRRVKNKILTDEEMIEYYGNLAKKYGGKINAYYKNAICLIINDHEKYLYDGKDIHYKKFKMVDKPHKKRNEGFPLDSISIDIDTNKYFHDLSENKDENKDKDNFDIAQGFRQFFIRSLKLK